MNELTEILRSRINEKRALSFAEFMEIALYEPGLGYYCQGKSNIGKEGDFYTSPHVNKAFGSTIAKFLAKSYELLNTERFTIIELGAGKGFLALDILNYFKNEIPELYDKTNYILIDQNLNEGNEAKALLNQHSDKVSCFSSLQQLEDRRIEGVVISNEFFDALPFHRLKILEGELQEIYVTFQNGEFIETSAKPSSNKLIEYYEALKIEMVEGQEFEIHLKSESVLNSIEKILAKGIVLTVDYGYLTDELFNSSRMRGTYKCLYEHQINEDPYTNIGNQDITAHVDFSNLILIGEQRGFNKINYTTQGQFLVDWGILNLIEKSSESDTRAIKQLFLPELMGEKFKVLIQEKNLSDKMNDFYPESPLKISFKVL